MVRLMSAVLKGGLGYELAMQGFTLYELRDDFIVLEFKDKEVARFTQRATIAEIRKAANDYSQTLKKGQRCRYPGKT